MRPSLVISALGLALAASGTFASATHAQAIQPVPYYPRPSYFQLSGACSMDLPPDRAVIVGGVSSSGLKPTDAVDQLEKQLALVRSYVAEKHGELQLMERMRTLKNPPPAGREDPELPFQVVQRMQVTFPPDAPVDAILQKLIELGMDRFGDNVLNSSNRREAVVRFRISNFDAKMNDLQQRCTVDAWKQWCAREGTGGGCTSQAPPANLELQAFNVRSKESLMRLEGQSLPLQFTVSRMQRTPEPPDLLGNVTVHLDGNITLTYHTAEEAQP